MAKRKEPKKYEEYRNMRNHRRFMRISKARKNLKSDKYYICPESNKRCYFNRSSAIEMLESMKSKGRNERSYYQCVHCGWYHLTSINQGNNSDES